MGLKIGHQKSEPSLPPFFACKLKTPLHPRRLSLTKTLPHEDSRRLALTRTLAHERLAKTHSREIHEETPLMKSHEDSRTKHHSRRITPQATRAASRGLPQEDSLTHSLRSSGAHSPAHSLPHSLTQELALSHSHAGHKLSFFLILFLFFIPLFWFNRQHSTKSS